MAASEATRAPAAHRDGATVGRRARRFVTETKAATKTTEFCMLVAAVVGILVSAL